MSANGTSQGSNVYVFKAQEEQPAPAGNDETGGIVGAIAACIVIVAVLVFLWKMLERKRQEMAEMNGSDCEELSIRSEEEACLHQETEQQRPEASTFVSVPENLQNEAQEELPNCTGSDGGIEGDEEELVLPSLSPVQSTSGSYKAVNRNLDIGKESTNLRRRSKIAIFDTLDLDMERPCDIVSSLKRSRQSLKQEMQERSRRTKEAIQSLEECQKSLQAARDVARRPSDAGENEIMTFVRRTREKRRKMESRRKYLHYLSFDKTHEKQKREAFLAMQNWFEGLHLRCSIRHVAEELFLLRSQHVSDLERNEAEKAAMTESCEDLEKCCSTISQAKTKVIKMQQDNAKRRAEAAERLKTCQQKAAAVAADDNITVVRPSSSHKSTRNRVKLLKIIGKPPAADEPSSLPGSCIEQSICPDCKKSDCQRFLAKTKYRTLEVFSSKRPGNETTEKEAESDDHFPLTLRLFEVRGSEPPTEQTDALSEREVRKALNRVSFITSIQTVAKGSSENEWILRVFSSKNRLAKIRFNCRGRAYIIGMHDESR